MRFNESYIELKEAEDTLTKEENALIEHNRKLKQEIKIYQKVFEAE